MTMRVMVRPVSAGAVPAALIGIVLWVAGVAWPFAVAAGVLALAVVLAWVTQLDTAPPLYAQLPGEPRPGTRSQVAQTAWSLRGRHGQVGDAGRKRLRSFAASRLARHGLDLQDAAAAEAIRAAVGDRAWAVLDGAGSIRLADIDHCVDRLESLGQTGQEHS